MSASIAEILTIGDEVLRGEIVDSNKAYLSDRLLQLDIECHYQTSVRDDPADMADAFVRAVGRCGVVLVSGGLGPTRDDLTAQVLARFGLAAERAVEAGAYLPRQFADTKLIRVPDVHPVIERISSRYNLDDAEQDAIWNAWAVEPGENLYAVINSLTRAGNDRGLGIEAREKLQELGGRIMSLASKGQQWID